MTRLGFNGLASREAYLARAKKALAACSVTKRRSS